MSERVHLRPCSPFNWLKRGALAEALGDRAAAAAARDEAARLALAGGFVGGAE